MIVIFKVEFGNGIRIYRQIIALVNMRVNVSLFACACVYLYVGELERKKERQADGQADRRRQKCVYIESMHVNFRTCSNCGCVPFSSMNIVLLWVTDIGRPTVRDKGLFLPQRKHALKRDSINSLSPTQLQREQRMLEVKERKRNNSSNGN